MYRLFSSILLLAIALFLPGCRNITSEATEQVQGRLLIWHPFKGKEAETLNSILDEYGELYPKVKILSEFFPEKKISDQFRQQSQSVLLPIISQSGLGPDLLISSFENLIPLIRAEALKTLDDYNLNLSSYLPRSISQVTFDDNLYGLPFALSTQVLCYNKTKVEQPLKTLPEIITEAEAKRQIALNSNFLDTLWGMQIFRSQSKSNPEYKTFDLQAWVDWLEWLRIAQENPNFILANERFALDQKFAKGKLAYYVCESEEISEMQAVLGADKLGVTTLPGLGNKTAGPLLYTKAIVFNRYSSNSSIKLALQLASFLTNKGQQTKLALKTESLIPVNSEVKLDRTLSPIQATLYAQSKTALAVSLDYVYEFNNADKLYGENYYNLVMAGEITPQEAALEFEQRIFELKQKVRQEEASKSGEE